MTATLSPPVRVTEPGVYDGMSDAVYHGDPVPAGSLSSSGARRLLPPSCPALFKHERDNPPAPKRTFDFGHAAHREVLGVGAEIEVVPGDRWGTNAAKEKVAEIRARGATPLKQADYDQVQEMAAALRAHPIAGVLLRPEGGQPEQSLFWVDDETGIWCRARLDWLPNPGSGRLIVPDYKSSVSVSLDHIRRAVHTYGYHQQAGFYLDGAVSLGLADEDAAFVFIFQMKTAPYLVTVVDLDGDAMTAGRDLNRRARHIYRDCVAADVWPGFTADVARISLPRWANPTDEGNDW